MPISYGQVDLELKLLPLILEADGSAQVTWRWGYIKDNEFIETKKEHCRCTPEEVSSILDTTPTEGLSRRDDLALAVYQWLVTNGHVPVGTVS